MLVVAQTGATNKAALPSLLIACKCDKSDAEREVDPTDVELKARRSINGLSTLQTSRQSADNHKRALSMMLKSIIFGSAGSFGGRATAG